MYHGSPAKGSKCLDKCIETTGSGRAPPVVSPHPSDDEEEVDLGGVDVNMG